ncbi:MAG: hypothetical protein HYV67_01035 [Candidatus Taylorbacteria bacterium]|nr:hypothetical protein [Candidatus Taylorbacteria bacterium]
MNKEYYSKLKRELQFYPYHRDYVHRVNGVDIDIPMIYEDASAVMCLMLVDIKKVINFIHNKRAKPVSVFMGKTLLAINVFEYRESAVGAFNEFTFSVPIMMDGKFNIPILPLIFDQRFSKLGFYVIQLGASNDLGRKHIEDIWGYPTYKNNLNISLTQDNGRLTSTIKENNDNILTISESLPKNSKFKFQRKRFNTYFMCNKELRHVELNTLLFCKTWIGNRDFKITIGDHEIGNILNELGIEKKIATVFYPNAVEIAGKAISV